MASGRDRGVSRNTEAKLPAKAPSGRRFAGLLRHLRTAIRPLVFGWAMVVLAVAVVEPTAAQSPATQSPAAQSPVARQLVAQAPAAQDNFGAPDGLRAVWDRTYSISKSGTTLRQAVDGLATTSGMAVVLDRRADPERRVTLDVQDMPLGQIWTDLAASCGLSVSWVGPVLYLGPPEAAAALRTLAALRRDDAAKLPPDLRSALATKKSISWADLEEPRSLLTSLSAEAGLRPAGDGLPHDLWPAARWPALSLVDRLTLLAIEFDRTFTVDPVSRTLTLTPIPDAVAFERSYPAPPNAADTVRRWQLLAPQASVRLVGNQVVVAGREEDHEAIATGRGRRVVPAAVAPAPPGAAKPPANARVKPPAGTRVFTLRTQEQPLSAIVDALRRQGNDVRMDEAALKRAEIDPAGRTSVEVKDATLVELLEAAGKPLGLTARQVGKAVELVPRP